MKTVGKVTLGILGLIVLALAIFGARMLLMFLNWGAGS